MSMRTYAINIPCAFVFDEEVLEAIWEYRRGYDDLSDDSYYGDVVEDLNLEEKLGLDYLGNFTGEGRPIDPSEQGLYEYDDDGPTLYYLESDKAPTLFTKAYEGFHEELLPEFKKKLRHYLPDDFPIEKYIVQLVGYVWG